MYTIIWYLLFSSLSVFTLFQSSEYSEYAVCSVTSYFFFVLSWLAISPYFSQQFVPFLPSKISRKISSNYKGAEGVNNIR